MKTLTHILFTIVVGISLFTNSELAKNNSTIAPTYVKIRPIFYTTDRTELDNAPTDTLTSVSAGDFNSPETWNHNRIPTQTDYIICRHAVVFSGDCHLYDKRIEKGISVVYSINCHLFFKM